MYYVIRDSAEYEELINTSNYCRNYPREEIPVIDFSTHTLLAQYVIVEFVLGFPIVRQFYRNDSLKIVKYNINIGFPQYVGGVIQDMGWMLIRKFLMIILSNFQQKKVRR